MKKLFHSFVLAIGVMLCLGANAQSSDVVKISSGIKGGTNWTLANEIIKMCGKVGRFENVEAPEGSPQSISRLDANQATAGIIQADVLRMKAKDQDLKSLKILFPMHSEQVHVLVRKEDWTEKKANIVGYGGKTRALNDFADLQGLPVTAGGGSVYTADNLATLAQIQIDLNTEIGTTDQQIEAVRNRQVAAAVIVGGARIQALTKLSRTEFKLLPLSPELRAAAGKFAYRNKTIAYDNLGTQGIPTVEVDALFMVYNFSGKKKIEQMTALRECFYENVSDMAETDGTHAAWRSIPKDKSARPVFNWDMYAPAVK